VRRVYGAVVVIGVLTACRGIVGITDLELGDAGTSTDVRDGGGDAGSADASPPADSGGASCSSRGPECGRCCRDNARDANPILEGILRGSCLCGDAGLCTSECAMTVCAGAAPTGPTACQPCMDQAVKNPACSSGKQACRNDVRCASLLNCLEACP
jgi:hypothetical protein